MNKNMLRSMQAIVSVLLLSACSDYMDATEANKSEVERCIRELTRSINSIDRDFDVRKPDGGKYDDLRVRERGDLMIALDRAKATRDLIQSEGEILKSEIGFSNEYRCPAQEITDDYRTAELRLRTEDDLAGLDEMNREIDDALNGVIDEYRKKAVRHRVDAGPGPRIDIFEMKDGTVVYCTTTITNAGKAVSCD